MKKLCLTLFLCPYLTSAQHSKLTVGDHLPALQLTGMLNYKSANTSLASFRGKWLILDFMATTCGSCIQLLPAFAALQQEFSPQVQIILVSSQPAATCAAFIAKRQPFPFPMLTADKKLKALFPHEYISHLVWIAPSGRVSAITSGHYLTKKTLQEALSGKSLHWPLKQDDKNYDYKQPLLQLNLANMQETARPASLTYTAITGHMPNLASRYMISTDTAVQTNRYTAINLSIPQLFLRLWGRQRFPVSQLRLQVTDTSRFIHTGTQPLEDWEGQNTHGFEACFPAIMPAAQQRQKIYNDLSFYFNCTASLQVQPAAVHIISKTATPLNTTITGDSITLGSIIYTLNKAYNSTPIITDDPALTNAWVVLPPLALSDPPKLWQLLAAHGYTISSQCRNIEILTITQSQ